MRAIDLTEGVLDGAAQHAFTTGACAAMALVLHEATGGPLLAVTDAHNIHDYGDGLGPRVGGGSCLHYGIRHRSGAFVDVDGAHTDADILATYGGGADNGEAAIGLVTEADVRDWYIGAQGEPVPLAVARTFVAPVLALLDHQPTSDTTTIGGSTVSSDQPQSDEPRATFAVEMVSALPDEEPRARRAVITADQARRISDILAENDTVYTITTEDVGRASLRAFGRDWPVTDFIGRILPRDVGKRVYLTGDQDSRFLQVENDGQRDRRQ